MNFQAFLVLLQGVTFLASAATIGTPANQGAGSNSLHLLPDTADPASIIVTAEPRTHTGLLNTNLTFDDEPQCLDELGTNLDLTSCRNIISKIPRSTDYITLGWRGRGHFDLTLPYVYVSGMYRRLKLASSSLASSISFSASSTISRIKRKALADFSLAHSCPDDGACVAYVSLKGTMKPDVFTFTGISEFAQRILQKCVADPSIDSGGVVSEIGALNCVFLLCKEASIAICLCMDLCRAGPQAVIQPQKMLIAPTWRNIQFNRHANERIKLIKVDPNKSIFKLPNPTFV